MDASAGDTAGATGEAQSQAGGTTAACPCTGCTECGEGGGSGQDAAIPTPSEQVPLIQQFDTSSCQARSNEACAAIGETLEDIVQRCVAAHNIWCGELLVRIDDSGCVTFADVQTVAEAEGRKCLLSALAALGPFCDHTAADDGYKLGDWYRFYAPEYCSFP